MNAHDVWDRYADWLYSRGSKPASLIVGACTGVSTFLLFMGLLVAPAFLLIVAVLTYTAGMHGIDRAYPELDDAPDCSRGLVRR